MLRWAHNYGLLVDYISLEFDLRFLSHFTDILYTIGFLVKTRAPKCKPSAGDINKDL